MLENKCQRHEREDKTEEPFQIKGDHSDIQQNVMCDPELDPFALMVFMGET